MYTFALSPVILNLLGTWVWWTEGICIYKHSVHIWTDGPRDHTLRNTVLENKGE